MRLLDSLFARFYDRIIASSERSGLTDQRRQLLAGLSGNVVEIGAGTGLNLALYPETVSSLTVTEPSPPMTERLRERAAAVRPDAEVIVAPAERLPFDDASVDAVVTTLVLCSVRDLRGATHEVRRVLRDDGRLVVIEHVAAAGRARTLQRAWEPVQKVVGRGCHMTRDVRAALDEAGFDTGSLVDTTMPGAPGALFPAVAGIVTPRAPARR